MDVNISDLSTVISFSDYYEGAAPALLLNHTPWVTISYRQRSEVNTHMHVSVFTVGGPMGVGPTSKSSLREPWSP